MNDGSDEFGKKYNESSFWKKIKAYAVIAGKNVIEKALILYYCLMDGDTPGWARATIVSALGYFIIPIDVIPDFIPVAGYSDDLGALVCALAIVAVHIKPEHKEKANEQLRVWLG